DEKLYDAYYNEFSNRILWFLHHYLWETPRAPSPGPEEGAAWDAYRAVNDRFAEMIADEAPDGAVALPQDYHLSLAPGILREHRRLSGRRRRRLVARPGSTTCCGRGCETDRRARRR